jgi:hypothetical protein
MAASWSKPHTVGRGRPTHILRRDTTHAIRARFEAKRATIVGRPADASARARNRLAHPLLPLGGAMHPSIVVRGAIARLGLRRYPIGLTYELTWLCNLSCKRPRRIGVAGRRRGDPRGTRARRDDEAARSLRRKRMVVDRMLPPLSR